MALRPTISLPTNRDVAAAAEGLRMISQAQLAQRRREGRPLPALYLSGVRYHSERRPNEEWQLPLQTLGRGWGDCEDLAAWRAAELNLAGELARVVIVRTGPNTEHALVRRGNGQLEDPSKRLGMKGRVL